MKFTVQDLKHKKENGKKITMLTASDFPMALLIDKAGIDAVLVGDSLGMTTLGYEATTMVSMDEMIHHAKAVRRGVERALLVGDMPYLSFQTSDIDAVSNAKRFVDEAGCDAVKLEGGEDMSARVKAIVSSGIPVIGHVGLTPQTADKLGGYKVQGKDDASASKVAADAAAVSAAGACAVVLECVPRELARRITGELPVPTIGIGAGPHCDGQVLVTHDIIGYFDRFKPRFVKQYADIGKEISQAVEAYRTEVEEGIFPDAKHSF
ncbi:MAG: 3-methyl-2-oxobutanoate hydroxymethyltransferase [Candidatus Omnitrophica bacterium]|nr:3-methyl-2-oxobutanoate hydroxymethyltransferase [Candidatus Omnitrophota bacterium]